MDIPDWNCETCRYSGPIFECAGQNMIECRKDHPDIEGFPIMPYNSWCWDGSLAYTHRKLNIDKK